MTQHPRTRCDLNHVPALHKSHEGVIDSGASRSFPLDRDRAAGVSANFRSKKGRLVDGPRASLHNLADHLR